MLLTLVTMAWISLGAGAASIQAHTAASAADYVIAGNGGEQLPTALAAGHWDGDNRSDVLVCSSLNRSCWLFLGRYASPMAGVMRAPNVTLVGLGGGWGA